MWKEKAIVAVRKQQIVNLEAELQANNTPAPASKQFLAWTVFLGVVAAVAVMLGGGMYLLGQAYPAVAVHPVIITLVSLGSGWFIGYCVVMTTVVGPSIDGYAESRVALAELKYDDLKEKRVGRVAYQPKEGAP
jgi:hypothetical protein